MLKDTLALAFAQAGRENVVGVSITPKYGMSLFWVAAESSKLYTHLPLPLDLKGVLPMVMAFLESGQSWETAEFGDWEGDMEHDGHNDKGWRVFCEDWGFVDDQWQAIVAIKPCWMWNGK